MAFNAQSDRPEGDFPIIPLGVYTVMMVAAELKDSNSTPGNQYMNCQFKVTRGKHKGAVIYKMFHCFPAEQSDFADKETECVEHLMYLMGVKKLKGKGTNWAPLFNKEVNAKIAIEHDDKGNYDDKNIISSRGFTEKDTSKTTKDAKGKKGKKGKAVEDPQDAPWDKVNEKKEKKAKKGKKDKKKGKKKKK